MAEIRIPLNLMLWGVRVPAFPKYSHEKKNSMKLNLLRSYDYLVGSLYF